MGRLSRIPMIMVEPKSQTVSAGVDVTLEIVMDTDEPLSYLWSKDGNVLWDFVDSNPLVLKNVGPSDAGRYRVLVGNDTGSVYSREAQLTVR